MLSQEQLTDFILSLRKLRERGLKGKRGYIEVMDLLEDATRYDGERGSIKEAAEEIRYLVWDQGPEKGSA